MDVSRLMILLNEAWSRVRDEGVGVMGDFIGKPFTATTMSELNYHVNAPLESINRELREKLGIFRKAVENRAGKETADVCFGA